MGLGDSKVLAGGAVGLGGCMGTAARCAVTAVLPVSTGFPAGTFFINVVGAFVLGALLEYLLMRGEDTGMRRVVRLCAGTGFCGGFTTYGTLAFESMQLFDAGNGLMAVGYLAVSVCVGVAAAMAGFAAAQGMLRMKGRSL